MDDNTQNVIIDEKKDEINEVFKINDYMQEHDKEYDPKNVYAHVGHKAGDKQYYQEVYHKKAASIDRAKDKTLEAAVKTMMCPLIEDHYKIKGKSAADRIMDPPPRFRWRSLREKRQESRRVDNLNNEFRREHPGTGNVPKFDNTTHKFRKNAQRYNKLLKDDFEPKYKARLETIHDWDKMKHFIPLVKVEQQLNGGNAQAAQKKTESTNKRSFKNTKSDRDEREFFALSQTEQSMGIRHTYLKDLMNNTLKFQFRAGMAKEDYMTTHYLELRRGIDQSLNLKDVLMSTREGDETSFWETLSPDMQKLIEMQAETAACFNAILELFGKKHHVDAGTGAFLQEPFAEETQYQNARKRFKTILSNHYQKIGKIREKNHFGTTEEDVNHMKGLAIQNIKK